jgi:hypothetical protein
LYEAGFTEEEDNIPMLLNDLEPIFLDNITSQLAVSLPEDQREKAWELLETDDFTGFFTYCQTNIKNYDDVFQRALDVFADEYLSNFTE